MFTLFFTSKEVHSFQDARESDLQRFAALFRYMLDNNFYISPSQFEANFISEAHDEKELNRFVKTAGKF